MLPVADALLETWNWQKFISDFSPKNVMGKKVGNGDFLKWKNMWCDFIVFTEKRRHKQADDAKVCYGKYLITIGQCSGCQARQIRLHVEKGELSYFLLWTWLRFLNSDFFKTGPTKKTKFFCVAQCSSCLIGNKMVNTTFWEHFMAKNGGNKWQKR